MTDEEKRQEFIAQLVEAEGNVLLASFNMGYTRRWVYNAIWHYRLWPLVNKLRADKLERQALEKKHGVPSKRVADDESG